MVICLVFCEGKKPVVHYIRLLGLLGLLALPFGLLLHGLRLRPPELLPHLLTCIQQPAALRKLGSCRLLTLEKPADSPQPS